MKTIESFRNWLLQPIVDLIRQESRATRIRFTHMQADAAMRHSIGTRVFVAGEEVKAGQVVYAKNAGVSLLDQLHQLQRENEYLRDTIAALYAEQGPPSEEKNAG